MVVLMLIGAVLVVLAIVVITSLICTPFAYYGFCQNYLTN